MKRIVVWMSVAFIAATGCKLRDGASDAKIIPGLAAAEGQFAGVVFFNGCSAVKVGPKHFLTSAGCLVDESTKKLKSDFSKGAEIKIFSGVLLGKDVLSTKVTAALVHNTFIDKLNGAKAELSAEDLLDVADVGLVVVADASAAIMVSELVATAVQSSQKVVVTGYGLNRDPFEGKGLGLDASEADADPIASSLSWLDIPVGGVEKQMLTIANRAKGGSDAYIKILDDDRGAPVYLDDSIGAPKSHKFTKLVAIISGSDPVAGVSYFARLDDGGKAVGKCINAAVAKDFDKTPAAQKGELTKLCGA